MSDALPFSELVTQAMSQRQVGLRELCREVGADPSYFSKILSGKRGPPAEEELLRAVARALGLDAPRLIVAAGRIPGEWRRLFKDEALFASVHALAAGAQPRLDPPAPRRWGRGPAGPRLPRQRDLGEELL